MESSYVQGLLWMSLAGVAGGVFILPMKFVRRWKWEHLWLVYTVLSCFVLPVAVAQATVPSLVSAYAECSSKVLLLTALFGAGWGVGSVCFGLAADALGMALGLTIATAIFMSVGTFVPMAVLTPDLLWTPNGLYTVVGNVAAIVGVFFCGIAGNLRDRCTQGQVVAGALNPKVSFSAGLTIAVAAGVFSAMFNFAYAFGQPIVETALRCGATPENAANAVWPVALPAGGIVNVIYCLHLMRKRSSWRLYRKTPLIDWGLGCAMSALWMLSVAGYGWGAMDLGFMGPSLGWSLYNVVILIATVACGLLTHEWDRAGGRPLRLLTIGVAILIVAAVLLGIGAAPACDIKEDEKSAANTAHEAISDRSRQTVSNWECDTGIFTGEMITFR